MSNAAQVATGTLHTIDAFESAFIGQRTVQVWLPAGYSNAVKYSVLYMHDGQMLYDASTTWNGQEWGVDEIAGRLQAEGRVRPFIVVSVFNGGELRYPEYLPQKPWEALSANQQTALNTGGRQSIVSEKSIRSDKYLKFLVKELKPYIDNKYSVLADRDNTFVAGSSMGGLISLYALGEYPDVFGGAACMSTHWPGSSRPEWTVITDEFMRYLKNTVPAPGNHKLYFDYGDQTLDAVYPPMQQYADRIMQDKGYDQSNWLTVFDKGAAHTEKAWRARLHQPLLFLFGNDL
ncbi:alpha/beta hydrolase [Alteromonas sediminis]|uniref:Alpha/beta hydrolase n=2 Tax=Alteromonas sediminis TaxID=2259342 RepID=A0A3N5ZB26_9ALTE|nr:alpha/beta hydrolase [Alteromonas sediminis]